MIVWSTDLVGETFGGTEEGGGRGVSVQFTEETQTNVLRSQYLKITFI